MIRMLMWIMIWLLTLGYFTIEAEYADGLKIKLNGWGGQ